MNKVNNHPYADLSVYFGTKHEKERAVAPILAELGIKCEVVILDTDKFGTFSGEVERVGSIRETLRKKIAAVYIANPQARLALASEGSFGPHPLIGFMQSDHEALLLTDRKLGIEIYAEEISTDTNLAEIEFSPGDELQSLLQNFLDQVRFPSHAVIVRPKGNEKWNEKIVFKGLQNFHNVNQAIIDGFRVSPVAKVILSTDMRANFNPARMLVIEMAAKKLAEKLNSFCPSCQVPGFAIAKSVPGLPCEECGAPSAVAKEVVWECVKCAHHETRPRPDGKTVVNPGECQFCNP